MEERRHQQTTRSLRSIAMPQIDYVRLANFRYAILTTISDDGYPFSITTNYQLTPDRKILLDKPILPSRLDGKRVNVLLTTSPAYPPAATQTDATCYSGEQRTRIMES